MQRSGGIIALIGAVFGVLAAIFTLIVGGGGLLYLENIPKTSFEASIVDESEVSLVLVLGSLGLVASFVAIIIGAISMNAKTKTPGMLLILTAICGAVAGGTYVGVCMVLVLAGGILATIGVKEET